MSQVVEVETVSSNDNSMNSSEVVSQSPVDKVAVEEVDGVCQSHSHRPEGIRAVAQTLTGGKAKSEYGCLTPNIKALMLTAFLFSFITVVQIFAAKIAHSQALLMDCISMGVDAFTYMGNIFVEWRKQGGSDRKGSQLIVCAISLSCLLYFTYDASQESWGTVQVCTGAAQASGDSDDVNGWITLGFGAGGVVFDLISLWAFYRSNQKQGEVRAVNMFTALLHVGADFLRSTSTVVMSLLILVGGYDSTCLDAYTSLLIGASIVAGGSMGVYNWIKLLIEYLRPSPGCSEHGKQDQVV